jgi:hypothetical protein
LTDKNSFMVWYDLESQIAGARTCDRDNKLSLHKVNTFRKMLDLSGVARNADVQVSKIEDILHTNTKQTSLSDFLK